MIIVFAVFAVLLLAILFLFASPRLSPIPYFPSNKKDMPLILKALSIKNNQTILDLGAGDGIVIFDAAHIALRKKLNTKFIAVEINPILYMILQLRRFFNKNKKNISIIKGDMFTLNYTEIMPKTKTQAIFYLYISPWLLEKTLNAIKKYKKDFYIISYMYALEERKHLKKIKGIHDVFTYKFS